MASPAGGQGTTVVGIARETVGMGLLLLVVVLWTASNFLGSVRRRARQRSMTWLRWILLQKNTDERSHAQTIFADNTYPKPFFVTYINTSLFVLPLFTILFSRTWTLWRTNSLSQIHSIRSLLRHLDSDDPKAQEQQGSLRAGLLDDESQGNEIDGVFAGAGVEDPHAKLGLKATARLSLEFCLLWVGSFYREELDDG